MIPLRSIAKGLKHTLRNWAAIHHIEAKYPGVSIALPSVWQYDDLEALFLDAPISFGAFCEIVVLKSSPLSQVPGTLAIGACSAIGAWCNIRAAGGAVVIGRDCLLGQHVSLIASNHSLDLRAPYWKLPWDETRTGIEIGDNCWIGAGVIVLPGCRIGDHAVIAAGSVVTKNVPSGEIWGNIPARKIGAVSSHSSTELPKSLTPLS